MKELSPIDVCGCGDTGYLTTRTVPIDLAHGAGQIHHVPVYHCGHSSCGSYNLPSPVASRLDDLAELMEEKKLIRLDFSWETPEERPQETQSLIEAFTWRFLKRKYEDAAVILVIPGQSVVLQSQIDPTEFYEMKYLPEAENGNWFSFRKFYSDEPIHYEMFLDFEPEYAKELGILALDEAEDALIEVFGEILE